MYYTKISKNLYLLDIAPLGYKKQIAVYLVANRDKLLLIDTGPKVSTELLAKLIKSIVGSFTRILIALTHIHIDHAGGVGTLVRKLEKSFNVEVEVLVHPRGLRHLANPKKLWEASLNVLGKAAELQGKPEPVNEELLYPLNDGESIKLGNVEVLAIHTPGHAPHHISFIVYPDNIAITGDAVAIHYDGRVHPVSPPPFKVDLAIKSIDKLMAMNPKRVAVSHFGVAEMDGVKFLEKSKNKIIEWYSTIKNMVARGIDKPELILAKLLEVDEDLRYIVNVRENNPIFKNSALQSVKGILGYILSMDGK